MYSCFDYLLVKLSRICWVELHELFLIPPPVSPHWSLCILIKQLLCTFHFYFSINFNNISCMLPFTLTLAQISLLFTSMIGPPWVFLPFSLCLIFKYGLIKTVLCSNFLLISFLTTLQNTHTHCLAHLCLFILFDSVYIHIYLSYHIFT